MLIEYTIHLPSFVLIPYLCCVRLTKSVKTFIGSVESEGKICEVGVFCDGGNTTLLWFTFVRVA